MLWLRQIHITWGIPHRINQKLWCWVNHCFTIAVVALCMLACTVHFELALCQVCRLSKCHSWVMHIWLSVTEALVTFYIFVVCFVLCNLNHLGRLAQAGFNFYIVPFQLSVCVSVWFGQTLICLNPSNQMWVSQLYWPIRRGQVLLLLELLLQAHQLHLGEDGAAAARLLQAGRAALRFRLAADAEGRLAWWGLGASRMLRREQGQVRGGDAARRWHLGEVGGLPCDHWEERVGT